MRRSLIWWALVPILVPGAALAHASERMVILTLPTGYYTAGAALVVTLTGLLAAFSGTQARRFTSRTLWVTPHARATTVTSCLSCLFLFVLIAAGFWGVRDPLANPLVLVVWTLVWVGVTLLSALFGEVWRWISPWYGPVRMARRALGLHGDIGLKRLGYWPAVAGFFGFAWFEIISPAPDDPAVLARTVAIYWSVVFLLALMEGEDWLRKGEALTVFFGFIALVSPLWIDRSKDPARTMIGPPGAGIANAATPCLSACAFILLSIASVSFDGLTETFWWMARIGVNPLEFPGRTAVMSQNTIGLVLVWAATALAVYGAVILARAISRDQTPLATAAGAAILSLLPIAAGYHAAHYLVSLITQGQYAIAALSDPFGLDWNLFDLPRNYPTFGFLADHGTVLWLWNAQVGLITLAHVLAVLLGLRMIGAPRESPRMAHAPMIALMALYTVFGLWLLSAATAT